jgi:cystathionine gamma-synthase
MEIETICVHGSAKKYDDTGAVVTPIFQTATYAHPGVGSCTGFQYSRSQNPTREALEHTLAKLENGVAAVAFATGMSAIACVTELFAPGDHIVASDDLYGGTHRLFHHISMKNGVRFSFAETPEEIRALVTDKTKAIFIETPTNPMMQVIDIAETAAVARTLKLMLIVDNTFLTPYFQQPLTLGADIVLHSGTKYLGGHNDTLAGFLVTADEDLSERIRFIAKTTGACLSPFDCFLIARGIKTLAVRMERQQQTAQKLAQWLTTRREVETIYYPGLPSHPGYAVSCKQARGFGAMLSFSLRSEEMAKSILKNLRLIQYAESLGGPESLITYPMLQTHADIPEQERVAKGINERLLRLSVGLESADDLVADLTQAMEGCA